MIRMIIPMFHVSFFVEGELNIMPRAMCRYRRMNIMEAPFVWMNRVSHPVLMSRVV
jgi:hypothetical protein